MFSLVCPLQQAFEGLLLLSSDITYNTFFAQRISCIHSSGTSRQVLNIVAQKIIAFVMESKKLSSIFGSACLLTFNKMKQQAQIFYFLVLGNSAIFVPRCKKRTLQWKTLERSRLEKRTTSFSSNIHTKKETCNGGELEPSKSSAVHVTQIRNLYAIKSRKLISFLHRKKHVSRSTNSETFNASTWTRKAFPL